MTRPTPVRRAKFQPKLSIALALRYFTMKASVLSFVSRLALLGLSVSVAILVIVLSVVNGFERELQQRVLGLLPNVTVYRADGLSPEEVRSIVELADTSEVVAASPVVTQSVLLSANGQLQGANLLGVVPDEYGQVTQLERYMQPAQAAGLELLGQDRYGIVLGHSLAVKLGVSVGDKLLVILAAGTLSPVGILPRQRRFNVLATIDSQSQLDSQFAYVNLDTAQRLRRLADRVDGVHIKTQDLFATRQTEAGIYQLALSSPPRVSNWKRNFGNLYQAIAVQKVTMFVLLSFLVGVAAFNLISGLMMIVEQRDTDIAILRTMGASSTTLLIVFVVVGLLLSSIGVGLGLLVGSAIAMGLPIFYAWITNAFELDLMTQYFISYLPVEVKIWDLYFVGGSALALAALAVVPPALKAARAQPSQVLAHE
ncbi:MAG: ABC transporter permease [Pseudomonadota bacterium]